MLEIVLSAKWCIFAKQTYQKKQIGISLQIAQVTVYGKIPASWRLDYKIAIFPTKIKENYAPPGWRVSLEIRNSSDTRHRVAYRSKVRLLFGGSLIIRVTIFRKTHFYMYVLL